MKCRPTLLLGVLIGSGLAHAQPLTLHYQERPPYSSSRTPGGEVSGLVATPAAQALAATGIAWRWAQTPGQRQLALIQSGQGLHCGLGWFRNEARAARGKFTRALYRDRPFAALARTAAGLPADASAETLLADRRWRLLVKEGYSYGNHLDALVERLAPATVRTSAEAAQMRQMLRSGRADWMIVAPEEAGTDLGPGLSLLPLSGMPPGPTRHLYCSADVPDDWIARIDAALPAQPAGVAAPGPAPQPR